MFHHVKVEPKSEELADYDPRCCEYKQNAFHKTTVTRGGNSSTQPITAHYTMMAIVVPDNTDGNNDLADPSLPP